MLGNFACFFCPLLNFLFKNFCQTVWMQFCRAWAGSKLFAEVISRQQKLSQAGNVLRRKCLGKWHLLIASVCSKTVNMKYYDKNWMTYSTVNYGCFFASLFFLFLFQVMTLLLLLMAVILETLVDLFYKIRTSKIFQRKIAVFFLAINGNICFGCSIESSQRDDSFEYPQHWFWLRNKKNSFLTLPYPPLVWRPATLLVEPSRQIDTIWFE